MEGLEGLEGFSSRGLAPARACARACEGLGVNPPTLQNGDSLRPKEERSEGIRQLGGFDDPTLQNPPNPPEGFLDKQRLMKLNARNGAIIDPENRSIPASA